MDKIFPVEITDADLALDIAKETWKTVIKVSKEASDSIIEELKIKIKEEEGQTICRHRYHFSKKPSMQLLGLFTTSLEIVAQRQIIEFIPRDESVTIKFSTDVYDDGEDEE